MFIRDLCKKRKSIALTWTDRKLKEFPKKNMIKNKCNFIKMFTLKVWSIEYKVKLEFKCFQIENLIYWPLRLSNVSKINIQMIYITSKLIYITCSFIYIYSLFRDDMGETIPFSDLFCNYENQFCNKYNENQCCTYENQFCTYENRFYNYENQFCKNKNQFCTYINSSIIHKGNQLIIKKSAAIYIKRLTLCCLNFFFVVFRDLV